MKKIMIKALIIIAIILVLLLGAATSITALKYKPDIDFVVADCGFADIYGVLYDGYKSAHVPTFLLKLASIGAKIRYGYSLKEMRPIYGSC